MECRLDVLTSRDFSAAIAFVASPIANGLIGAAIPVGATWDNYRDPPWLAE